MRVLFSKPKTNGNVASLTYTTEFTKPRKELALNAVQF